MIVTFLQEKLPFQIALAWTIVFVRVTIVTSHFVFDVALLPGTVIMLDSRSLVPCLVRLPFTVALRRSILQRLQLSQISFAPNLGESQQPINHDRGTL